MDALTTAQKTAVTKSSMDRLRLLLMRYGYAEEAVLTWSREELMNKYAELLAQGIEPPGAVRAVDPEAEKQRMAHEMEMKQMEMQLEKQRLDQEQQRLEQEEQKLRLQEQLEMEKLAFEKEKFTQEARLKAAELEDKQTVEFDEAKLLKRYGDALAQVISSQPEETTDLPAYFRGVEAQFENLRIPAMYHARLM